MESPFTKSRAAINAYSSDAGQPIRVMTDSVGAKRRKPVS
jgi:hypothetical protein